MSKFSMVIICKSTKCGTKICQNSTIYLTNEMSSTNLNRICCCCWEQLRPQQQVDHECERDHRTHDANLRFSWVQERK